MMNNAVSKCANDYLAMLKRLFGNAYKKEKQYIKPVVCRFAKYQYYKQYCLADIYYL